MSTENGKFPFAFPAHVPTRISEEYTVQVKTDHLWKRDRVEMLWDGFNWWWTGDEGPERFTDMVTHFWTTKANVAHNSSQMRKP